MVIGAGDIDFNGGLIVEDAIVDGDLVGEGECFAVSEELEGGTEGVKVPVEDCGVSGRIDDGVRLTLKKELKSTPLRAGSALVPAEAMKRLGVNDVGGIEVLDVEGARIGESDAGLI